MKKVLSSCILLAGLYLPLLAQQVANARFVNLVTTSSSANPLNVVSKGGISFIGNSTFQQNGALTLYSNPVAGKADWLDSTTGVLTPASTGTVNFTGLVNLQNITGPSIFYGLTIQGAGVNLNQSNEVRNLLSLNSGLIYISHRDDSLYVSNPALASVSYTTNPLTTTSWVHGKLSRRANTAGAIYEFPVGKIKNSDSLYAPVKLEKQTSGNVTYSVQYFPDTPVRRASINPYFNHISELEFWEITSHNYSIPVDNFSKLSLSWRTYSDVSPVPAKWDSLAITHYIDPGANDIFIWEPEIASPGAIITPGSTANFGYFTNDKFIDDFMMPHLNFTIGTRTIANALPINLLDYQVQLINKTVLNLWRVTNDAEVDHYEIERSPAATGYTRLGTVPSSRSAGITDYTFTDQQPLAGWNYYRLKIVEDNHIEYSPVRRVFIGSDNNFTMYPNPAQDFILINLPAFDNKSLLSLIDNAGRIISQAAPQSSTVRLSLTKLPAGVYYIRFISGGNVYSKSFVHP
jgi:hypothetical protein